jgi:diaminopimelate epimerase
MLRFEKWEGLGNDFVVVDADVTPDQARALCDRRLGIGADGVLMVRSLQDVQAERWQMTVLNADGSRPEMCGNGLRCVAAHLAERRGLSEGRIALATDAGDRDCDVTRLSTNHYAVTASMGVARVGDVFRYPARGLGREFLSVDVGNPHAVSFEPFDDEDVDDVGRAVEREINGGTNVEFCQLHEGGRRIDVVVWERGVGRTMACGTGACAVAAAATHAGKAPYDEPLEVRLPGGALTITVGREGRALQMRGPARRVFTGETSI